MFSLVKIVLHIFFSNLKPNELCWGETDRLFMHEMSEYQLINLKCEVNRFDSINKTKKYMDSFRDKLIKAFNLKYRYM